MKQIFTLLLLIFANEIVAQTIPTFKIPRPASLRTCRNFNTHQNRYTQTNSLQQIRMQQQNRIRQQNQRLIEATNRRNAARRNGNIEHIPPDVLRDIWEMEMTEKRKMSYCLPSYKNASTETHAYYSAFEKIAAMLDGNEPLSLKKAVFLVENAYFNNALSWEGFEQMIQQKVDLCHALIRQNKLPDNAHNRKMAIFSLLSDTLKFDRRGLEKKQVHLPYRYDFDDFYGQTDWSKQFVSKLLNTQKGQCHSMPLLYLILAQEMRVDAYLSTAPEHFFVKIKDQKGNLQNLEITNGMFTTNAFILASGYIKTEALRNKIYMDTLNLEAQIARCLSDLAQGYYRKFGFDDFVGTCVDKALNTTPNNLHAMLIKSDYYTTWFKYLQHRFEIKDEATLRQHPEAIKVLAMRNQLYKLVDDLGYEPMPKENYEAWLESLKDATQQQKNAEIRKTVYFNEIK